MFQISRMRCTACAVAMLLAASAQANSYTIVDLGAGFESYAINNRGVIAGTQGGEFAARWREGHWSMLSPGGVVNALNEPGDIAGWSLNNSGAGWPAVWPRPAEGDGRLLDLPTGAVQGVATGIDNHGRVAGYFYESSGGPHCFLANDGKVGVELVWPNGDCSVQGMNSRGQLVGRLSPFGGAEAVGFVWQDDHFQKLRPLPGDRAAIATAINDLGVVIGSSGNVRGPRGVLWRDGVATQIGPTKGYRYLTLTSINKQGVIVGYGAPSDDRHDSAALRFEGTDAIVLATEVVNLGNWRLNAASSVNDDGVIVGWGGRPRGVPGAEQGLEVHAFALYPASDRASDR
jgi:uncharacterized membrane protein